MTSDATSIPVPDRGAAADEAPVRTWNPDATRPMIFLCDHGGNRIPQDLENLGLPLSVLGWHIAWDIGAAEVTARLASRFGATALISRISRLVIDCNRGLNHPDLVPQISDGVRVPGNEGLGEQDVSRRVEACYHPYHDAVESHLQRILEAGDADLPPGEVLAPAVISVHSFTPVMDQFRRPWHIGCLWNTDGRIALPVMQALRQRGDVRVGDNEPYSGREGLGGSMERHALPFGRPNLLIEIRQDLIDSQDGIEKWSDILYEALEPVLSDPGLYRTAFFPAP